MGILLKIIVFQTSRDDKPKNMWFLLGEPFDVWFPNLMRIFGMFSEGFPNWHENQRFLKDLPGKNFELGRSFPICFDFLIFFGMFREGFSNCFRYLPSLPNEWQCLPKFQNCCPAAHQMIGPLFSTKKTLSKNGLEPGTSKSCLTFGACCPSVVV